MEEIEQKANQWITKRATQDPNSQWSVEDVREAYIAGHKASINLPKPDCHFFDEEKQKWVWAYSVELINSITRTSSYCQSEIEGSERCGEQCLHCHEYYKYLNED